MTGDASSSRPLERWGSPWLAPVDERLYALFRIAVGITALWHVIRHWHLRHVLWSSEGIVRPGTVTEFLGPGNWSLFHLSDNPGFVTAATLAAGVAALFLIAGIGTRPAAVFLFIMAVSWMHRGYPFRYGGDRVLIIICFLVAISPVARVWRLRLGSRE